MDVDGVRTVAIITVLWALAFVVLAFRRNELEDEGRGWWIWACLAGVGLGLLGLEYCRKRRDAIARAELDAEADAGFDDAGDWADGELAALATEGDPFDLGFEQPTQTYSPYDRTPPAAPLPFDPPPPLSPPARQTGHNTGEGTYSPRKRPPPGYVTGDFPAVSAEFPPVKDDAASGEFPPVRGDMPPAAGNRPPAPAPHPPSRQSRPGPPPVSAPRDPAYPDPTYAEMAAPAGYLPDPDQSRRHPRDEELARRYREEQTRAAAAGYEPRSYPEFLADEAARQHEASRRAGMGPSWSHEPPRAGEPPPQSPPPPTEPGTPPRPRQSPGFDSEFFTDEPVTENTQGADFLLDDDDDDDDESGGDYRGRRARRD